MDKEQIKEIIEELGYYKEFNNVEKIETFKFFVNEKLQKNPNGYFIMGDINNLRQINEQYNNVKVVDKKIEELIIKMEQVLQKKGFNRQDYHIGKRGDEIYIYIPGLKEKEIGKKIVKKLNKVTVPPLSISIGGTSKLQKGLPYAIQKAENKMKVEKAIRKSKEFQNVMGEDIDKVLSIWINEIFSKLRISNIQEFEELEKSQLAESMLTSREQFSNRVNIRGMTKNDIKKNVIEKNKKEKPPEDKTLKQIECLKNEPHASEQERDNWILSQLLSYSYIGQYKYETADFFKNIKLNQYLKNTCKNTLDVIKDWQILIRDFSGIKKINDSEGYQKCDEEVYITTKRENDFLEEIGIEQVQNIISLGFGTDLILAKNITKEQCKQIENKSKIHNSSEKLMVTYSKPIKLIDNDFDTTKYNNSKEMCTDVLEKAIEKAKMQIEETKRNKKIKDVKAMGIALAEQIAILVNHPIVQVFIQKLVDQGFEEQKIVEELIERAVTTSLGIEKRKSNNMIEKEKTQ